MKIVKWSLLSMFVMFGLCAGQGRNLFRQGKNVKYLNIESYQDVAMYNWAENVQFKPEIVFFPKNQQDLVAIVKDANAKNKKITIMGKGHSWNPLMEGSSYLISTIDLNKISANVKEKLVTVEAGATIKQVDKYLARFGLVIPCNIVGTTDITYGGIMATGSHGAGASCPTMSDFITQIEIVKANGEVELLSKETHGAKLMDAARMNLGLFGVMHKITFKAQKSFNVHVYDEHIPRKKLFKVLPKYLREKENVEVLWFPFTKNVIVKSWNPTNREKNLKTHFRSTVETVKRESFYYIFKYFLQRDFENSPHKIPGIIKKFAPHIFPEDNYITDVGSAIHYINEATNYPINETEIALPFQIDDLSNIKKGWDAMVNSVYSNKKKGKYPLNIVVHMRFLAGSTALMSPSRGNERTCYMDFGSFYKTPGWKELVNEIWETWKDLPGVKLHWAKDMRAYNELDISSMYGKENVETFLSYREEFDPNEIFLNDFMKKLFKL